MLKLGCLHLPSDVLPFTLHSGVSKTFAPPPNKRQSMFPCLFLAGFALRLLDEISNPDDPDI